MSRRTRRRSLDAKALNGSKRPLCIDEAGVAGLFSERLLFPKPAIRMFALGKR